MFSDDSSRGDVSLSTDSGSGTGSEEASLFPTLVTDEGSGAGESDEATTIGGSSQASEDSGVSGVDVSTEAGNALFANNFEFK